MNPSPREGGRSSLLAPQARPRPLAPRKMGCPPWLADLGQAPLLRVLQGPPHTRSRTASEEDPRTQRRVHELGNCEGRGGGPGQGRLRTEATACPLRVVVRWGHGHRGQSSMDDPSGTHYTPPVHNDLEARRTRSSGQKEVRPETKPTPRTRAITPPTPGTLMLWWSQEPPGRQAACGGAVPRAGAEQVVVI